MLHTTQNDCKGSNAADDITPTAVKLVSAPIRRFNLPGGAHLEQDSYTQWTKPLETKQDAEGSEEG